MRLDPRSPESRVAAPLDPGSHSPGPMPRSATHASDLPALPTSQTSVPDDHPAADPSRDAVSPDGSAGDLPPLPSPQTSVPDDHSASEPSRGAASPTGSAAALIPRRDPFVAQAGLVLDRTPSRTDIQVPLDLRAQTGLQTQRQSPGPRPGAVSAGPRRHTVAAGETFASIANHYYGSTSYEAVLWRANRIRFPRPERLAAGDLIIVPTVEHIDSSAGRGGWKPVDQAPARATLARATDAELDSPQSDPSPRARTQPSPPVGRVRTRDTAGRLTRRPASTAKSPEPPVHIVHRYETLRSIARDRLGDVRRVDEIVELNRDRLSDDDRLTPGLLLYLPADARPQDESR